ncbi:MAG: EVE domain-containing protein [Chloroflexi bacterium]|nr:EVE domain-containing protein [Chloroflexota bacterium]
MAKKNYWLMKSEPSTYSFDDLKKDGDSEWDGVRNYQARNNMQAMKVGDGVLFYHSQSKPNAIVGTAVVVKEAYPDFTAWDAKSEHPDPKSTKEKPIWYMVDIKAGKDLPSPVSLEAVKATPALSKMWLVTHSRLSVQPVTAEEWDIIMRMGKA